MSEIMTAYCGLSKGVETCAHCDEYGCEIISSFWEMAPKAKENLEAIRAKLN